MSSNLPDLSGKNIGEYEIGARVGIGGMGAVYEGKQPLIGKRVAVKVLLPSLSGEAELVERFLSEARAVNEIRHRGIVDIFSFGQLPDGAHYFVMEFLEGEAFDRIIKKRAPLPLGEALTWMEETLDALDAAHSAGIIHRDIKPSNIFLVNTGRGRPYVKLLDFGIAKLGAIAGEATPQTRASVILGTPDYISPEQARGKPISPQTDLYAIGCVLFELVTGERVFRGENTLQTMWMHVEDKPRLPSSVRPDLPPELDELILWCLEKESAQRPPSAGHVRDTLAAIRQQYSPTGQFTPPPSISGGFPVAHTPPPSVRNRVLASTPSGGHPPLGTPAPGSRSGGQSSLSGRRPAVGPTVEHQAHSVAATAPGVRPQALGEGAPASTRLSPLTALGEGALSDPSLRLDGGGQPPLSTSHDQEVLSAPRSPLPFVLAGLIGVVVLGLVAFFAIGSGKPPAPPPPTVVKSPTPAVEVKPVAVTPEPTPVVEVKPAVEPPPVPEVKPTPDPTPAVVVQPAVDPVPAADPKPVADVKPKSRGITTEQLVARLKRIEVRLTAHEAEKGERDNVVRQFVDQARKDIKKATTDADRRDAWSFLGDIEGQLKP